MIWSSAQFRFRGAARPLHHGLVDHAAEEETPMPQSSFRAKIGRILGATVGLFTVMKGLPLAYSKDMQEDKEQVFDASDALMLSLAAMEGMVRTIARRRGRPARRRRHRVLDRDGPRRLAGARGRSAVPRGPSRHRPAGGRGRGARRRPAGSRPRDAEIRSSGDLHRGVYDVLGVDKSVASRTSFGGTAPVRVREQIAVWKERLG